MSVNVKTAEGLQKIASNVSIAQADWNQRENTAKNTRILNQPETLTTMEEVNANTNENALAGAMAVKEGFDELTNSLNTNYIHVASTSALNYISIGWEADSQNRYYLVFRIQGTIVAKIEQNTGL